MRGNTWRADRFRFVIRGGGAQRFLSRAAGQGIRLRRLRWMEGGYSGVANGGDRWHLQALAKEGGWEFLVEERRGPGTALEKMLARPGILLGLVLFLALVKLLTGFVWAIDFGGLDDRIIAMLREELAANSIWEGAWLPRERLQQAQQRLSAQSDSFGWISLNFTGGCLFVESTEAQYQTVQPPPSASELTAKAGGQVLAVQIDSGFALVKPGQYVEQGQVLANAVRPDRDGDPVTQSARGHVTARVIQRYTGVKPLQSTQPLLTGARTSRYTLFLPGGSWQQEKETTDGLLQREWIPLTLGRVALPGCLVRETWWEQRPCSITLSSQAARALARRDCMLQLLADFPDAQIESIQYAEREDGGIVRCSALFTFCADIASEQSDFSTMYK
ncbi:MAG: sporulation protein YqfD [Gemmiger sp.]